MRRCKSSKSEVTDRMMFPPPSFIFIARQRAGLRMTQQALQDRNSLLDARRSRE
jgi:hypothetical protein